jgi:cytochrome c oxidase assembly factor CtaG
MIRHMIHMMLAVILAAGASRKRWSARCGPQSRGYADVKVNAEAVARHRLCG